MRKDLRCEEVEDEEIEEEDADGDVLTCSLSSLSDGWSSGLNSMSANNSSASFSYSKSKSSL